MGSLTVIVWRNAPAGARGQLTRWMLELEPGVFVGRLSARVREGLWERALEADAGEATLVLACRHGLGFELRQVGIPNWRAVEFDGVQLVRRTAA